MKQNPMYGKTHSEATRKKMSLSHIGKPHSDKMKINLSKNVMGEKNPNWKGGITKDKNHLLKLHRINNHIRRSKEKRNNGSFTYMEWDMLKKQYSYACPLCYRKEPEISLTVDHIIPLSRGGSNYISNIQPLCLSCNQKKFTKSLKATTPVF